MSAREAILARVRANQPSATFPLPDLPSFPLEGSSDCVGLFLKNLEAMGGRHHAGDVRSCIDQLFPQDALSTLLNGTWKTNLRNKFSLQ